MYEPCKGFLLLMLFLNAPNQWHLLTSRSKDRQGLRVNSKHVHFIFTR